MWLGAELGTQVPKTIHSAALAAQTPHAEDGEKPAPNNKVLNTQQATLGARPCAHQRQMSKRTWVLLWLESTEKAELTTWVPSMYFLGHLSQTMRAQSLFKKKTKDTAKHTVLITS